jgi:uncharacterized protein (DUF885 family)
MSAFARRISLAFFATVLHPELADPAYADPAAMQEGTKLHQLFDDEWQWKLREYPEFATSVGDPRFNHKLTDLSAPALERRKAHERDVLRRIRGIDRAHLTGQDVLSFDLFLRGAEQRVALQRYPAGMIPVQEYLYPYEWMPICQMSGVHINIGELPRLAPLQSMKDYDGYLARLTEYPRQVDQVVDLMRRGMAAGWVPPALPIRAVLPQIEKQWVDDATRSPLYKPFENFPEGIAAPDRSRLEALARRAITGSMVPALKRLHQFIAESYLPACRQEIAASRLPGGPAYYEAQIHWLTSSYLPPQEIHEIGRREVTRIRKAMDEVIQQTGFSGSLSEFLAFLQSDPRFGPVPSHEVLPAFRDIAKRVDPELPKLFAELPRTPYGVREIPAFRGETAPYYSRGTSDGTRAGFFNAPTLKGATWPRHEMEALFLHEAMPGHHLQISRAQELRDLPDFRRTGYYSSYGEGWALYAEGLGEELGLYKDPHSKFGRLKAEIFRACRLVVDTGMHSLGWTREHAIDYMKANTGLSESFMVAEVDRYIVWPGQALGYKLGELKIKELRAKASKALGDKFDIRKFHNALIDDGPLPLDLLEQRIDEWIERHR